MLMASYYSCFDRRGGAERPKPAQNRLPPPRSAGAVASHRPSADDVLALVVAAGGGCLLLSGFPWLSDCL